MRKGVAPVDELSRFAGTRESGAASDDDTDDDDDDDGDDGDGDGERG